MKILLINTNPVVSRLVSLCVREPSMVLEEVAQVSEAKADTYDIVFVDDDAYNDEVSAFLGWVAKAGKIVYFSGRESGEEIGTVFDTVIHKPFLPSHVQQIIESVKAEESENEALPVDTEEVEVPAAQEESHSIFPLAAAQESVSSEESEEENGEKMYDEEAHEEKGEENCEIQEPEPKVLDSREIEQIKALLEEEEEAVSLPEPENEAEYEARKVEVITQKLEEEGLEIVPEEEIIAALGKSEKKAKKKKKTKKKRAKKRAEEVYTFEEALLAAVENMKPKKIKKLLKDAEVTISIRFKDKK